MRKIKNGTSYWARDLKNVQRGTCKTCGGKGRYKETYKYKNPIIRVCLSCRGTGKVQIQVRYTGELNDELGLWRGSSYDLVSENEDSYTIINRHKELLQIDKELFELVD